MCFNDVRSSAQNRPWADSPAHFSVVHDPGSISHQIFTSSKSLEDPVAWFKPHLKRDSFCMPDAPTACLYSWATCLLCHVAFGREIVFFINFNPSSSSGSSVILWFYRQLLISDGEPGWCTANSLAKWLLWQMGVCLCVCYNDWCQCNSALARLCTWRSVYAGNRILILHHQTFNIKHVWESS